MACSGLVLTSWIAMVQKLETLSSQGDSLKKPGPEQAHAPFQSALLRPRPQVAEREGVDWPLALR